MRTNWLPSITSQWVMPAVSWELRLPWPQAILFLPISAGTGGPAHFIVTGIGMMLITMTFLELIAATPATRFIELLRPYISQQGPLLLAVLEDLVEKSDPCSYQALAKKLPTLRKYLRRDEKKVNRFKKIIKEMNKVRQALAQRHSLPTEQTG